MAPTRDDDGGTRRNRCPRRTGWARRRRTDRSTRSSATLVAAALLLAGAFTGCGGEGDADGTDAPRTTSTIGDVTEPDVPTDGTSATPNDIGTIEPEEIDEAFDFDRFRDVAVEDMASLENGTLVRHQRLPSDDPSRGARFRILYRSETPSGEPTFVTGMLAVPPGEPPDGGWGLVSHAHGSTGLADDCAPSARPDDLASVEAQLVQAEGRKHGLAVVSTDYEGQGGPGRHPFLNGVSEARSVLDAARAARQVPAVEITPTETGLAGYSQGGHAILWANQLAATWAPELEITGTVAGAPASEIPEMVDSTVLGDGGAVMLLAGLATDEHEEELATLLTDDGRRLLEAMESSCDLDPDGIPSDATWFETDPPASEPWPTLLERNTPGEHPGASPILLVHGDADLNVPVDHSVRLLDRLCAVGDIVERRVVEGADHIAGAVPAYGRGLDWLAERRAGEPPTDDCPNRTRDDTGAR